MAEILTVFSLGWLAFQANNYFQSPSTRRRSEGFWAGNTPDPDASPYDDENPLTSEEMSNQVCHLGGKGRCIVRLENGEYVADLPDREAAARMIVELRRRLQILETHMQQTMDKYDRENIKDLPWSLELKQWAKTQFMDITNVDEFHSQVKRCQTFLGRLPNVSIGEKTVIASSHLSSFTISKRDITMCMREDQGGALYDINTLNYVFLHELAHVMSDTSGHDEEFIYCFQIILRFAIGLGLYNQVDYALHPIKYCSNIDLSASVMVRDLRY